MFLCQPGGARPHWVAHRTRQGIVAQQLVVHSDNGAPMKGETMLATMQRLGVAPSRSRPSVSNDNPYSESLFRTLKYRPAMPVKPFETLLQARRWVSDLSALVQRRTQAQRHPLCDAKPATRAARQRLACWADCGLRNGPQDSPTTLVKTVP